MLAATAFLAGGVLFVVKARWKERPSAADQHEASRVPAAPPAVEDAELAAGKNVYGNYCAACHGESGEGNGPAARFLYPKPRNFTEGNFRLVTSTGRMPSDADLLRVVERGMPGSAMFPFAHLGEPERRAAVRYVRSLMQAAVENRLRRDAAARGETLEASDLAESVADFFRPGPALELPPQLDVRSPETLAHGRALYAKTCAGCHGDTGRGDGAQLQQNSDGTPTQPRDFTRGIFKGGGAAGQLYARIMLGMPGSPMPASANVLKADDVKGLVQFIQSLSDPAAAKKVEHRRTHLVARRTSGALADASETAWASAPAVPVVVSPLWWRNYAEPDLHVQALHDGKTLALRLSWADATRNDLAVRPQDFEDMAAVQLTKAVPEPFLGMGTADRPVDIWHWRAARGRAGPPADVDVAYPNMAVDLYPFERTQAGGRPHALERQAPEFITARAAGNLRSDPAGPAGAHLQAGGFGTLTMRPRPSQVVRARAGWHARRWTVVFQRPLNVGQADGVPLAPGDRVSVAFAIWDGAARDRNGQKLVSIWHDLELEQ